MVYILDHLRIVVHSAKPIMSDVDILDSENAPIQRQVLAKLLKTIVSKKPPGKCLSSSTPIPELNVLFSRCVDNSPVVSTFCCKALVTLAVDEIADFNYVSNKLYSMLPTSKNYPALVSTFSEFILWDLQSQLKRSGTYKCPYSLKNPVHPFIVMLEQKPDSWPVILDKVRNLLQDEQFQSIQEYIWKALYPLTLSLYLDPQQDARFGIMRYSLWHTLTDTAFNVDESADLIFDIVAWLQITSSSLPEVVALFQTLYEHVKEFKNCNEKQDMMLCLFLALCEEALHHNLGISSILCAAEKFSQNLKHIPQSFWGEMSLSMISVLLMEVPSECLLKLLNIARNLIIRGGLRIVAAMLIPSSLQLVSDPLDAAGSISSRAAIQKATKFLLGRVERHLNREAFETSNFKSLQSGCEYFTVFTPFVFQASVVVKLVYKFETAVGLHTFQDFITRASKLLHGGGVFSKYYINLLSSVLICYHDDNNTQIDMCLPMVKTVASVDQQSSTVFLSVLLYKLVIDPDPSRKLKLLQTVSQIATHKFSVAIIVNILQLLGENAHLKPLVIKLMVLLWKAHDRCFLHLYKLLADDDAGCKVSDVGINELLIAKASALKEICEINPEKYGPDLLNPLSMLLDKSKDEDSTIAAAYALKGIATLCKAEVIDVKTTWESLKRRLLKDSRPLVVQGLFELLSLVPSLPESPETEKFQGSIRSMLWRCVSSESNPVIIGSAYKALASFHYKDHTLKILPDVTKQGLQLPASKAATPFEMGKKPEDVLTFVPGTCFITLMKSLNHPLAIKGYGHFLTSVVKQEIMDIPRGVYFSALKMKRGPSQSSVLGGIQGLLCSQFASHSKPAIQANLAMGVLLSYEPPCEMDKEGRPLLRSLVSQSRYYEDIVKDLIQNVPVDINEWRRSLLLPQAWSAFMERAFLTCVEGRNAELEMQKSRGVSSEEEVAFKIQESWLWVRDRLMEAIKLSSKGKPSSLANGLLAFGGLISAVNKFYLTVNVGEEARSQHDSDYQNHASWMTVATETILCAYDLRRASSKNVFSFLLAHLAKPTSPSGTIARGCASLTLYQLVPYFLSKDAQCVPHLLEALISSLEQEQSPTIQFYYRISLALTVSTLYQENFTDDAQMLQNCLQKLLQPCIEEDDNVLGIGHIVGLTICATKLCHVSLPLSLRFVTSASQCLKERLYNEDCTTMNFEVLCICVANIYIVGVHTTRIGMEKLEEFLVWCEQTTLHSPQCSGAAIAFGMMVAFLQSVGHSKANSLYDTLRRCWLPVLGTENQPTLARISALKGLCAMYFEGGGFSDAYPKAQQNPQGTASGLADLVGLMIQLLKSSKDVGLQNICAWLLGEIYSKQCHETDSSIPSTYSYLKEDSVLRYVTDMVLQKISQDSVDVYLETGLEVLAMDISRPFPPLNWTTVLSPLLHSSKSSSVLKMCLQIILRESSTTASAASLLFVWTAYPNMNNLPLDCRIMLMESLPQIAKVLPAVKLQGFLDNAFMPAFSDLEVMEREGNIAAKILLKAVQQISLPQDQQNVLNDTITRVLSLPDSTIAHLKRLKIFETLCDILSALPSELLKDAVENAKHHDIKTTEWAFSLVEKGKLPLESLNPYIEEEKECKKNRSEFLKNYLDCCATAYQTGVLSVEKCQQWMLNLFARVRMAASKANSLQQLQLTSPSEIIHFYLELLTCSVVAWCDPKMSCLVNPSDYSDTLVSLTLSGALQLLLSLEPWSQLTEKIMVLLLELTENAEVSMKDKSCLLHCLCALRNMKQFGKSGIWKSVITLEAN